MRVCTNAHSIHISSGSHRRRESPLTDLCPTTQDKLTRRREDPTAKGIHERRRYTMQNAPPSPTSPVPPQQKRTRFTGRVGAPGRVAPARRPAADGRGGAPVPVLGGRRPGGGRAVARRHGDDRRRRRRRLRPASATSRDSRPRGGPPRRAAARGRGAHAAALAWGRRDALDAPVMMMLYP